MILQIKTIRAVLKVSTDIFTSITACPIELPVIDTSDNVSLNLHNCYYSIYRYYQTLIFLGKYGQENFWAPEQKETCPPPPILQIMILKLSPPRWVISKEESVQQK